VKKKPAIDLYVIVDKALLEGRDAVSILQLLLRAGVRWFQYRDKYSSDDEIAHAVGLMLPLCREADARLIVNDRVEIASQLDANGVHLGRDDAAIKEARRILGEEKVIGYSARSVEMAKRAESAGADYLGVGAIYQTGTKKDARVIGLAGLADICKVAKLPVVAIGGITRPRVSEVLQAGATGIAVASAVLGATDVAEAARGMLEEIGTWKALHEEG
jgi:thiamine-phosphate pyrophosphorylase